MEIASTFLVAFAFSFVGTIPPGTLSLTIIQLGLNRHIHTAWRMALAAALIEYPYAWIAVRFQRLLSQSIEFTHNFHLVSAVVMISLGTISLWSAARPTQVASKFEKSGFRRGVVLSLLNPLAIPFWLAMTAYLKNYGWVDLSDDLELHAYLLGVSSGTLVLLMLLAFLAQRVIQYFKQDSIIKKVPGAILTLLGIYSFVRYISG